MRLLLVAAFLAWAGAEPAASAEAASITCLGRAAMEEAVASPDVVPPTRAVHEARAGLGNVELVRVRLCRNRTTLMYIVTFLRRDGKIVPVQIDAASGRVLANR